MNNLEPKEDKPSGQLSEEEKRRLVDELKKELTREDIARDSHNIPYMAGNRRFRRLIMRGKIRLS